MKTKYTKVEYKDMIPGKEYIQIHPVMIKNSRDERKAFPEPEWVEEVPDYSEEAISLLEEIKNSDLEYLTSGNLEDKIRELLNKVKNEV